MDNFFSHWVDRAVEWVFTAGVRIVVVLVATFLLLLLVKRAAARFQGVLRGAVPDPSRTRRAETLSGVMRDVLRFLILTVGGLMVLSELGLDLKPLLAAAGIGGFAIGFGAQTLVKDVISGFFVLLEDQIRVGDTVEVAGVSGTVEEIRLRTISLRDGAGALHVVPHGSVDRVRNLTRDHAYAVLEVPVSHREDVDAAAAAIAEAANGVANDPAFAPEILAPFEPGGVDGIDADGVLLSGRVKVRPGAQTRIARALRRAVKRGFDAKGIDLAVSRHAVSLEEPLGRAAVPLRIVNAPAAP